MPIKIGDTWAGCIYDDWEGTESIPARVREGDIEFAREGLNTDSTIPGRLAFHRQSGPSTTDRKVRVFPPSRLHAALLTPPPLFLTLSSLLCSFLVSWLLIEALSLSIIRDRVAGAPRLFLRLVERSPLSIRILSPSSSRRAPAVDIASIESDVEGALSGSWRRPEYPAATSSVPPLLLHFLGETPEMTPMRGSPVERRYQTKFRARAIFLSPDRFGISNTFLDSPYL